MKLIQPIKHEQILILDDFIKAGKKELITLWLADQLYSDIDINQEKMKN